VYFLFYLVNSIRHSECLEKISNTLKDLKSVVKGTYKKIKCQNQNEQEALYTSL
jgi:hypothetical protein